MSAVCSANGTITPGDRGATHVRAAIRGFAEKPCSGTDVLEALLLHLFTWYKIELAEAHAAKLLAGNQGILCTLVCAFERSTVPTKELVKEYAESMQ
jgi:hypothetical protein